jgi:hydroxypyruvate isomerase
LSVGFTLKFAPHLSITGIEDGTFSAHCGPDPVAQATFVAEQGFRAIEDNFFCLRSKEEQARLARTVARLGLEWGCLVGTLDFRKPTFALGQGARHSILSELRRAIATAKSVGARQLTVMPGFRAPGMAQATQFDNAVIGLVHCAAMAGEAGVLLCLEAINRERYPDNLAYTPDQAAAVCRAVGSPWLKVLFDVYHIAVEALDPVAQVADCFDQIGSLQIADHPGRMEPGTGSLDYASILRDLRNRGFDGIIGMEHGCAADARQVVETYRALERAVLD